MLFNSTPFFVFFAIFFILYWFVFNRSLKLQNILLLTGSYVFYAWWDWRFLALLIGSSLVNYLLGFYIAKTRNEKAKSLLTYIGVVISIGLLIYFKYTNFFITSFIALFSGFGISLNIHTINLILPLGISFYTFKSLSYLFDINKGKIEPASSWCVFFVYVAFFPAMVSGPIDKARTLIPQLEQKRTFSYPVAADAMRQILWGLFKKVVIADRLAIIVNEVFANYKTFPGSTLAIGAFCFAFQLYTDFSGYTDMALGFARLLGFNITPNFNYPFFAQNIADFWRRWHMSLTSWLTEYVFTPLSINFRDYGKMGLIMAIIINFIIVGIWHGANWTFVLFGFLHGCYYIPLILKGTLNKKQKFRVNKLLPSFAELGSMLSTFMLVCITFIIFRSASLIDAFDYISRIFSSSFFIHPGYGRSIVIYIVFVFVIVEWLQREKQHALQIDFIKNAALRFCVYFILMTAILFYASSGTPQFIYLKF